MFLHTMFEGFWCNHIFGLYAPNYQKLMVSGKVLCLLAKIRLKAYLVLRYVCYTNINSYFQFLIANYRHWPAAYNRTNERMECLHTQCLKDTTAITLRYKLFQTDGFWKSILFAYIDPAKSILDLKRNRIKSWINKESCPRNNDEHIFALSSPNYLKLMVFGRVFCLLVKISVKSILGLKRNNMKHLITMESWSGK